MKKLVLQLSAILLSFCVVVSGAPFQLYFSNRAHAQEVSAEPSGESLRQDSLEQLRQSFLNPDKGEAHLDPFLLSKQIVIDERSENIEAVVRDSQVRDYKDRIEFLEGKIEELSELEVIVKSKLQGLKKGETHKLEELTLVLEDIISRKKLAELDFKDLKDYDPRTGKGLPIEHMVDESLAKRHNWGNNLTIQIVNKSGDIATEIKQKEFTESLSPEFNKENPLKNIINSEVDYSFIIANKRGEALHHFKKPVEALFFFGHYLVYIEKESLRNPKSTLPLRFIDLNYFRANIGNAPLPVYSLPLNIKEVPKEFLIKNGTLRVGESKLSYAQISMLAKVYQVVFNVNVALVDPSTYKNSRPLVNEIFEFFNVSVKSQDKLFHERLKQAISTDKYLSELTGGLKNLPNIDRAKAYEVLESSLADGQVSKEEYKKIKNVLGAQQNLTDANHAVQEGRSLMNRLKLLMRFMIQPRPEGAPKLFNSLVMVATHGQETRKRVYSMAKESLGGKMAGYGVAVGGTILAASQLPEPYALQLYQSLDLISATWQHFQGYLSHINYGLNYADLSKDALVTSTTGWTYFISSYISDGVWTKFLYGLGQVLLVPLKLFATIHITVNSYKLLKNSVFTYRNTDKSDRGFVKSFIEAARTDHRQYWESLSQAEEKASGSDASKLSEAEVKLLTDHIERLKENRESMSALTSDVERSLSGKARKNRKRFYKRYAEAFSGFKEKLGLAKVVEKNIENSQEKLNVKEPDTIIRALTSTFLSYSSLKSTFKFNALTWNYLFISRSFFFSPSKWLMAFIYPNYFKVAVTNPSGKQHFPSRYNGGLNSWPELLKRAMSRAGAGKITSKVGLNNSIFLSKESLDNLREFEKAVGKVETIAIELSMKRAQMALIENVNDPKRLLTIFDSSQRTGEVSTGIRNLHDKKLKKLTKWERLFFRAFYTRTFDTLMQKFLGEMTSTSVDKGVDPETFAKEFVKEMRSKGNIDFYFTEEAIEKIETKVESEVDFKEITRWSKEVTGSAKKFVKRTNIKFRHKLLDTLHPKNPQVNRFLTAREKVEEARAMERAMRMEVSSLFSSIPMGILSTLALYAGVKTGAIMPFDPAGFNSETHYMYMSKYLFYNGFIPGLIIGLMADTWMKVQEDSRIDALGGFDKAITLKDSTKGFWRYFMKNAFKNPKNKWKDNHIFILKLITANIPAALVTITVANFYGLGRFDLGAFLGGYIVIYSTFLSGVSVKMGQAFELASTWIYGKVPRKLRAHPEAQKYFNGQLQKRKILFSYMENFWEIIIVENIAGTMLTLKDNVKYGTRSFLRLIFGGGTPTTILVNFVDTLVETFKNVPGMEATGKFIKYTFSNNYEAFERYPKELVELAPEVVGLQEAEGLPKNKLAEALGKGAAAVGSIGAFASVPYIGAKLLDLKKERKLQKQGVQLRSCKHIFSQ